MDLTQATQLVSQFTEDPAVKDFAAPMLMRTTQLVAQRGLRDGNVSIVDVAQLVAVAEVVSSLVLIEDQPTEPVTDTQELPEG